LISGLIFAYVLFFADPDERAVTQGMLMGSVSVVVTLLMLLLLFFHLPHGDGLGTLRPTAMERSLRLIQAQIKVVGLDVRPPCDSQGRPLSSQPLPSGRKIPPAGPRHDWSEHHEVIGAYGVVFAPRWRGHPDPLCWAFAERAAMTFWDFL